MEMKKIFFIVLVIVLFSFQNSVAQVSCPVPLYTDPVHKGSADPEVIWNEHEKEWWIFYTARHSEGNVLLPALAIGVSASKDWINWTHKGYIKVDGIGGTPDGPDVLWAPGIIRDGDTYHMFLTFKKGDGDGVKWGIPESLLLHLTAPKEDLLNGWNTKGILHVPFNSIDATVVKNNNTWYLFHRGIIKEKKGVTTFYTTTKDINAKAEDWDYMGASNGDVNNILVNGYNYQEGQFVFYWKDLFWMLTDPSNKDIAVYNSKDLETWKLNGVILEKEGKDELQKSIARHPSVVVLDDRAFIFYFNQPYKEIKNHPNKDQCLIQIAELKVVNGKLTCDRDAKVFPPKKMAPLDGEWGQKKK